MRGLAERNVTADLATWTIAYSASSTNIASAQAKVRRERMGHIELAAPCVHIWYLRGTRSWLAYLLAGLEPREELKAKQLEKVIYFAAHLVSWVDEDGRHEALSNLEAEYLEERDAVQHLLP